MALNAKLWTTALNVKLTNGSECQTMNDGFEHQIDECGFKCLKTVNGGFERQTDQWL